MEKCRDIPLVLSLILPSGLSSPPLGAYPWLFSTYQRGYIHNGRTGMCIWNVMSVLKPEQLTEVLIQVYDVSILVNFDCFVDFIHA